jgi:hypothetical protein
MKPAFWIILGIIFGVAAWAPLNLDSDPRDIPIGAFMLGVFGTLVGGVIVLVAAVQWARRNAGSA